VCRGGKRGGFYLEMGYKKEMKKNFKDKKNSMIFIVFFLAFFSSEDFVSIKSYKQS
jgi:hypothetical protein